MKSEDLLNQPLFDDSPEGVESANALEAFLEEGNTDESADAADTDQGPGPSPFDDHVAAKKEVKKDTLELQLDEAQAQLDLTMLTPEERYKKQLEKAEITLQEAQKIIDCVMIQMRPWRESYKVGKNTRVTFQTRMPADTERLHRAMEDLDPKFATTRDYENARYNLAASVVRYGSREFERETEEDIGAIVEWLRHVPNPLFTILTKRLWEFDRKIDIIFQDGYTENF